MTDQKAGKQKEGWEKAESRKRQGKMLTNNSAGKTGTISHATKWLHKTHAKKQIHNMETNKQTRTTGEERIQYKAKSTASAFIHASLQKRIARSLCRAAWQPSTRDP